MDPFTGRVLAMAGGFSFNKSEYNRVTQAKRQPGSAFKPFIYALALENNFTPSTLVLDAPIVLEQGIDLKMWKPENYGKKFYGFLNSQTKTDKIFDETAVVGVQEFASRLQSGLVPNFARWADFTAGSEVPKEERDSVNNDLDEVTEYVFEVIQNSNFGQEVHESFMDLAVGTGVLHVQEGDAVNPVVFSAIPLPHVVLDTGPDDKIDHVYRERKVRFEDLPILYPDGKFSEDLINIC